MLLIIEIASMFLMRVNIYLVFG